MTHFPQLPKLPDPVGPIREVSRAVTEGVAAGAELSKQAATLSQQVEEGAKVFQQLVKTRLPRLPGKR